MVKNILIIKGASQYGAARCFCDELQDGFCRLGHLVTMLDLTTFSDTIHTNLFDQFDMIFSFDLMGIEFYNAMDRKPFFWTMLIDPPIYLHKRLKQANGDIMVSCIDRRHVIYLDKYYKNIPWTCFMPHGGITGAVPAQISYSERKYDVIFLGSLAPFDSINEVVDSLKKHYDPLVSEIIEAAMQNPDTELDSIVTDTISSMGMNFDDDMLREFMFIIRGIDTLKRYYKRKNLIDRLTENGVAVDIWGNGWDRIISNHNDLIRLHGEVTYEEAKYLISNSKILINDMPPYHEGSHERVFAAMQCGTIVATDRSVYLEECFRNNKDIIFYDRNDIRNLTTTVSELLNDTKEAQNIIDNAYNLSLEHTWAMRASSILEITDMLHHDPFYHS